MTNILAIDTSTQACSVALFYCGERISRYQLASREHTRLILPMVDEILSEAGIALSQLDALAFTAGPGSFTGIRIGFGVIQGLAFGAGIPVLPVSTLEALAQTSIRKLGIQSDSYVLPILDARMEEVYWALFKYQGSVLTRVSQDSLTSPEDVASSFSGSPLAVVGDGWHYLDEIDVDMIPIRPTTVDLTLLPEAEDILDLALPRVMAGQACSVDSVSPVYLRDKITWKKRVRLRQ